MVATCTLDSRLSPLPCASFPPAAETGPASHPRLPWNSYEGAGPMLGSGGLVLKDQGCRVDGSAARPSQGHANSPGGADEPPLVESLSRGSASKIRVPPPFLGTLRLSGFC